MSAHVGRWLIVRVYYNIMGWFYTHPRCLTTRCIYTTAERIPAAEPAPYYYVSQRWYVKIHLDYDRRCRKIICSYVYIIVWLYYFATFGVFF